MNERDSEAVAAQLLVRGYTLAPDEASADVILLNTCSVRDQAEQKALNKMTNVAASARRERPNAILGFMGCMAQSMGKELLDRLPDVDLVLGTQKFHRAGEYLDALLAGSRERIVDVDDEAGSEAEIRQHVWNGNGQRSPTAFVSIMQGCNQYCTFCIVPYTRGQERSRTIEDIMAECQSLAAQGVKEITFLGQIVTSFGRRTIPTRDGKSPFVQLLEAANDIEGLERIRFTSPHPKGYGDDVVEAYGRLPKLVESAHIPVQSGSNRVLKLMHRGYTVERYIGLTQKLRGVQPNIGISTDMIVGFPGETDQDFEESVRLVREVRFDQAYVFRYSTRRDTPAAEMPNQLAEDVKEERNQRMLRVVNEIAGQRYGSLVGRTAEILVEGPSKRNPERLMGRTRCNRITIYSGPECDVGNLVELRITRAGSFTLYGEPVEPSPAAAPAEQTNILLREA
jgi:tRNA-2-methylthio-N6-dimethylallyladenosine synthase